MIAAESIHVNVDAFELVKVSIVEKIDGDYKRVIWLEAEALEDAEIILNGRFIQKSIWFRGDDGELPEAEKR